MRRLGLVTQVTPLRVKLNGDTADAPAVAMHDFSAAVVGVTEVIVETLELRRFAWHANPGLGGAASVDALNAEITRALAAEATAAHPLQMTFVPAATWTFVHGLGRRPLVQLLDDANEQFDADVEYPDLNTVVITHATPLAGTVLVL